MFEEGVDPSTIKTKFSNPYDYDPIVQFIGGKNEANATIYSDHLYHWDAEKHDALSQKHFGNDRQYWDDRDGKKIQAFVRDWCNDQALELTRVTEYCNVSTDFPTWRLDYYQGEKAATGVSA